jgi:hypothetical protein
MAVGEKNTKHYFIFVDTVVADVTTGVQCTFLCYAWAVRSCTSTALMYVCTPHITTSLLQIEQGAMRRSCAGGPRGGRKNNHPPIVQRQFLECVQLVYVGCGGVVVCGTILLYYSTVTPYVFSPPFVDFLPNHEKCPVCV